MRTTTLVLMVAGVGLLLGGALVASFKIPCRDEIPTSPVPWFDQISRIDCNVWGQPLRAASLKIIRADKFGRALNSTFEEGPYPNYVRQGKWRRAIRELGKPDVTSDVWYLDGREVPPNGSSDSDQMMNAPRSYSSQVTQRLTVARTSGACGDAPALPHAALGLRASAGRR